MHGMQLNEVHVFAHNSNLSENSRGRRGRGGGIEVPQPTAAIQKSSMHFRLSDRAIMTNLPNAERCISCRQQSADNTVTRDMRTITQQVKKCAASYQHFFPKLAQIFT